MVAGAAASTRAAGARDAAAPGARRLGAGAAADRRRPPRRRRAGSRRRVLSLRRAGAPDGRRRLERETLRETAGRTARERPDLRGMLVEIYPPPAPGRPRGGARGPAAPARGARDRDHARRRRRISRSPTSSRRSSSASARRRFATSSRTPAPTRRGSRASRDGAAHTWWSGTTAAASPRRWPDSEEGHLGLRMLSDLAPMRAARWRSSRPPGGDADSAGGTDR